MENVNVGGLDINQIVDLAQSRFRLPALSVALSTDGGLIAGWVSQGGSGRGLSTSTRFRIGSVSKAVTSVAFAELVERGDIDLDSPVGRYVPGFPVPDTMTIRHLAGHFSGLPHYRGLDFVNRRSYRSLTDALDKFKSRELVAQPGERFSYSSFGWNLLGAAMEVAAGRSFRELLDELVLIRHGMTSTALETSGTTNVAKPYVRLGRVRLPAPRTDPSDAYPSAGLVSTPTDLVRLGRSFLSTRQLSASAIELLWSETVTSDGAPTGYGLGWHRLQIGAHRGWGHGGSHVGATALLAVLPEPGVVISLVTNTNAPPGSLTETALEVVDAHSGGTSSV